MKDSKEKFSGKLLKQGWNSGKVEIHMIDSPGGTTQIARMSYEGGNGLSYADAIYLSNTISDRYNNFDKMKELLELGKKEIEEFCTAMSDTMHENKLRLKSNEFLKKYEQLLESIK